MMNKWLVEDYRIHLPKLFEHLGFQSIRTEKTHRIFENAGLYYIVIYTEEGFLYYKAQRPKEKLSATDLITEHVSKIEGVQKEMLWDKVAAYHTKVLETDALTISRDWKGEFKKVPKDFNHFDSYRLPIQNNGEGLYGDAADLPSFTGRMFLNEKGEILFPLFNMQNTVCGYFVDAGKNVAPYRESAEKHALWYSNIPKKIDGLFLFKNPKEALAFHKKFQLKNVVYMALGEINSQTTDILFQIRQTVKVDKIMLSFTGEKKIEGYLRDLHFITFIKDSGFKLSLTDRDMVLRFPIGDKKAFSRFYDHTKRYNKELAQSFLRYNNILDQHRLNRYGISVSKNEESIKVRLPLETNAIKLLVWSYYKNYLNKAIDILKPKSGNWYSEWETMEHRSKSGKEVQLKEYRIAL